MEAQVSTPAEIAKRHAARTYPECQACQGSGEVRQFGRVRKCKPCRGFGRIGLVDLAKDVASAINERVSADLWSIQRIRTALDRSEAEVKNRLSDETDTG
jgi:hypothetical protein